MTKYFFYRRTGTDGVHALRAGRPQRSRCGLPFNLGVSWTLAKRTDFDAEPCHGCQEALEMCECAGYDGCGHETGCPSRHERATQPYLCVGCVERRLNYLAKLASLGVW